MCVLYILASYKTNLAERGTSCQGKKAKKYYVFRKMMRENDFCLILGNCT